MAKKGQFQKGVEWVKKLGKKNGKKTKPGLLARAGGFLIGAMPIVVPVPGTIARAQARAKEGVSIASTVHAGMFEYVNGLSSGIGLGPIFPELDFYNADGSYRGKAKLSDVNVPRGSTWGLWIVGFTYMAADKLANLLNSGKGMNVPGTRTPMIRSG